MVTPVHLELSSDLLLAKQLKTIFAGILSILLVLFTFLPSLPVVTCSICYICLFNYLVLVLKANFTLGVLQEQNHSSPCCPCPRVQHGAALSEGRPSGSLRRDLAGLPLLRRLPPVCAGALLGGGAEDGSLPQAALLPAGSGHGPDREVEGRCAHESRDTKLRLSGGRVKARYQGDCHFRLEKKTPKSVDLVEHENIIFKKKIQLWKKLSQIGRAHV